MARVAGSAAASEALRSTPDASSLARHRAPRAPVDSRPANRAVVPRRDTATAKLAGPPPGWTVRCAAPSMIPSGGRTASATTSPTTAMVGIRLLVRLARHLWASGETPSTGLAKPSGCPGPRHGRSAPAELVQPVVVDPEVVGDLVDHRGGDLLPGGLRVDRVRQDR